MRKLRLRSAAAALLVIMALLAAACGGSGSSDPGTADGSGGAGAGAGDDAAPKIGRDIVLAIESDPTTFDPHKSNDGFSLITWRQMYNTLVTLDTSTREVLPSLAQDWEYLDDRTLRMYLRDDVTFHDGQPLTAEDVVFSLLRLIDPATASPAAYLLTVIDTAVADDDHTVTITTKEPFAPLLFHLTHPAASIVSKAVVEADPENWARNPIGTGPFKFVEYRSGDRVVLARNDDYFAGQPVPETVTFRIIPEASTQVSELESGGVHIAYSIPRQEVARLQANPDLNMLTTVSWGIHGIIFNVQKKPFDDVRVRQALNYALNRDAIVQHVEFGLAEPAAQVNSPVVFGHDPALEPYPYDPEKARQLLAEAGYPDGFKTSMLVWNLDQHIKFAEVAQAQFAEIGVEVELDVMEFGAALERQYEGDFEMTGISWGTPTLDADYNMYALLHSDNWGSAGNWGRYKNERVDELIMTGRVTPDVAAREAAYHEASRIVLEDAPWVFSHHAWVAYGLRSELKDATISISWIYTDLVNAYLEE